jgi:hypothetical protein
MRRSKLWREGGGAPPAGYLRTCTARIGAGAVLLLVLGERLGFAAKRPASRGQDPGSLGGIV